jgi:hypothetical protein
MRWMKYVKSNNETLTAKSEVKIPVGRESKYRQEDVAWIAVAIGRLS